MTKTLFLTLLLAASTMAADVKMKPSRISLFKNGYGLVTLSGTLDDAARTRLGPLPVPTVGTFWVSVGGKAQLRSVVAGMRDYEVPAMGVDMSSLIAANPGKKVTISYLPAGEKTETAHGTIIALPTRMERTPANVIGGESKPGDQTIPSAVMMLRTDDGGTLIIPTDSLRSLNFKGECAMPRATKKKPTVELELAKPAAGAPIEVTCLASGISWQPSYLFKLGKDGKGTLSAKATISNNLMDISGADIELITGKPILNNTDSIDPIALQNDANIRTYLSRHQDITTTQAAVMTNMMTNRLPMSAYDSGMTNAPAAPMGKDPAEGVQTADLFFYPLKDFSAKAGEVVIRPLFSVPVEHKSVYIWDAGDPKSITVNTPGEVTDSTEVWHCVRFVNPLKMPLTTAYVEYLDSERIAGTGIVSYTPPGKECTARVNLAINVSVFKKRVLIERTPIKLTNYHDAVRNTSKVTLALNNGTANPIDVEVIQRVDGYVTNAGDGKIQLTGQLSGPDLSNPGTIVRWNLHIEPGKEGKIEYTYSFNEEN